MTALTYELLRARVEADKALATQGDSHAADRAARQALGDIGFRAVGDEGFEQAVVMLPMVLRACVARHQKIDVLFRDVADLLYQHSPALDGSSSPVSAYLPAAREVVSRYIRSGR